MKLTVKQLTTTGVLLAICIISQLFKNASVYITGPIINAALILATLYCGILCGAILGIITPVTAYFITGAPIMAAVPLMFPAIMLGNVILVLCVGFFYEKIGKKLQKEVRLPIGMAIGSVAKGAFMGVVIALVILPNLLPEKMLPKLSALQIQFSITQLFTALIGSVYAYILHFPLEKSGLCTPIDVARKEM